MGTPGVAPSHILLDLLGGLAQHALAHILIDGVEQASGAYALRVDQNLNPTPFVRVGEHGPVDAVVGEDVGHALLRGTVPTDGSVENVVIELGDPLVAETPARHPAAEVHLLAPRIHSEDTGLRALLGDGPELPLVVDAFDVLGLVRLCTRPSPTAIRGPRIISTGPVLDVMGLAQFHHASVSLTPLGLSRVRLP